MFKNATRNVIHFFLSTPILNIFVDFDFFIFPHRSDQIAYTFLNHYLYMCIQFIFIFILFTTLYPKDNGGSRTTTDPHFKEIKL